MISAPMAACTVTGTPRSCAASRIDASRPGSGVRAGQRPGQTLAHALVGPRGGGDGRVHLRPGLLRHPEAAVGQPALHVLARPAECRQLEVVNRRGAVERDVGDDAARDQRAHERTEPDLHDVPAEEQDDPVAAAGGGGHAGDDGAQIARGEHVGKGGEEGGEGAVGAGRRRQQRGVHLVAPPGDGDRGDAAQVGLAVGHA